MALILGLRNSVVVGSREVLKTTPEACPGLAGLAGRIPAIYFEID